MPGVAAGLGCQATQALAKLGIRWATRSGANHLAFALTMEQARRSLISNTFGR